DDVSFRRVVNVPARGIGKTVLEALESGEPADHAAEMPLLAAGLQPVVSPRSLWSRMAIALEERRLTSRANNALAGFRDLIAGLTAEARDASVSAILTLVLERSGYLRSLR